MTEHFKFPETNQIRLGFLFYVRWSDWHVKYLFKLSKLSRRHIEQPLPPCFTAKHKHDQDILMIYTYVLIFTKNYFKILKRSSIVLLKATFTNDFFISKIKFYSVFVSSYETSNCKNFAVRSHRISGNLSYSYFFINKVHLRLSPIVNIFIIVNPLEVMCRT